MSVPPGNRSRDILLSDARRLVGRAVDKAEDIGMRGAFAVVGGSGTLVSLSRMDHGGAGGAARARSKAWIAATQQIPSLTHQMRMGMVAPAMVPGFVACSPEAVFPGAGGMPIEEGGWVTGGFAASGAVIGPFVGYPGSVQEKLIADGGPANGEDLIVHYALGISYAGQHGDDHERWVKAYGELPADIGAGLGMSDPPPASHQHEYRWGLGLADHALELASERGVQVAVAIADSRGEAIRIDRMDGAPSAAVTVAETTAAAAASFQCPSEELADRYDPAGLQLLAAALPFSITAIPGALPISEAGEVVAALGIGGPAPGVCRELAAAALANL